MPDLICSVILGTLQVGNLLQWVGWHAQEATGGAETLLAFRDP